MGILGNWREVNHVAQPRYTRPFFFLLLRDGGLEGPVHPQAVASLEPDGLAIDRLHPDESAAINPARPGDANELAYDAVQHRVHHHHSGREVGWDEHDVRVGRHQPRTNGVGERHQRIDHRIPEGVGGVDVQVDRVIHHDRSRSPVGFESTKGVAAHVHDGERSRGGRAPNGHGGLAGLSDGDEDRHHGNHTRERLQKIPETERPDDESGDHGARHPDTDVGEDVGQLVTGGGEGGEDGVVEERAHDFFSFFEKD